MFSNDIYTSIAKYYDFLQQDVDYKKFIDLIEYIQPSPAKVLDIGCGTGTIIDLLNQHGYECIGCDVSLNMIKHATKKNPNSIFFARKSYELPGEVKDLDLVILTLDTLNYILDKSEIIKMGKDLYERIAPNGFIICDIQKPKNINLLNNYHEIRMIDDEIYLEWNSYKISNFIPQINHELYLYQHDQLIGHELHKQKYMSVNYYRSLWFKYFKLVQKYSDEYRYYLIFKRR